MENIGVEGFESMLSGSRVCGPSHSATRTELETVAMESFMIMTVISPLPTNIDDR